MDTLSFGFLSDLDGSVDQAQAEFARREFAQALRTIDRLPELFQARADVLELKAKSHEALLRFPEAAAAWQQLVGIDPSHAVAHKQLAWCYSKIGANELLKEPKAHFDRSKFADALASLDAGPAEWRKHAEFHRMKGLSHERLGQFALALASWTELASIAPSDDEAAVRMPVCLAALGDLEQAAVGFRSAAERFPENMAAQFNWLFHRVSRGGAADAIALTLGEVQRLRALTGNSQPFKSQLDTFKARLLAWFDPRELAERDIDGVLELAPTDGAAGNSLRSIYEQFEPVGNNCEFGFAQRKHAAEPLALFRWTSITPENLLRLLGDRLEGYDTAERYRLEENREREFILKEDFYGTASHTYVKASDADAAALLDKLARRQSFLKRKFMETAAEGRKIFVYKHDQPLDAQTMDAVQSALMTLGVRKLLFVMRAGSADTPGAVCVESADRVIGFISDVMPNTQFLEWDEIVKQAHRHFA